MNQTRHLSLETMEKLVEGTFSPEVAGRLQAHIAVCQRCQQSLDDLRAFNAAWDSWSAGGHARAFAEYLHEKRQQLSQSTTGSLNGLYPEGLTRLQRKRFETWHRNALTLGRQTPPAAGGEAELSLLAAAPAFVGAVRGEIGTAFGVGVDEKTGQGALIKVTAHVGDEMLDTGNVTLVGAQVERQVHRGVEYQLTAPLTLLKKKLIKRFETIPALAALNLGKREVHIEVDLPQYLFRSESLILAVIVAVAKAASGNDRADRIVYSAQVGLDGTLRKVGHLKDKASVIARHEGYRWVVAAESLEQMAPDIRANASDRIDAFDHVAPLFRHLRIPERMATTPAAPSPGHQKGKNGLGWAISAAALTGLVAALTLVLASNHFFVISDLVMAWHLSAPTAGVLNLAQSVKWILVAVIALRLLIAGTVVFGRRDAGKRRRAGGLPGLALLLLAAYVAGNLQHFTMACQRFSDNFTRYEQIEYLRHTKLLSGVTVDLPDYRYLEFARLASRPDTAELQKAVEIGVATHPVAPTFGDTFVQVVVILMDKVNSTDLAARALGAYAAYVETLEHRPADARALVADTLTAAEDLMNRYQLAQALHQGRPYGTLLKEISNRYQL